MREKRPIFLHTLETNDVARFLLENESIRPLKGARIERSEVTVGKNRFDFLLRKNGEDMYLEVKSCTLFGNGIAMFPDAVTARGKKHLLSLAELARQGSRSAVLFLVHFPDVQWFMPDYHTDFDFSSTMLQIRNRVQLIPAAIGWNEDLSLDPRKTKILKIPWNYLKREISDGGSYLLIVHLAEETPIQPGRLPASVFRRGYYVYVGSAMTRLSARLARHQRRSKNMHWHIDYLTAKATSILPLPIRSSVRLECRIAEALASIMPPGPAGFGSSDCGCDTHLFRSPTNPIHRADFHHVLQQFRMRPPASP
jgi:sugar fermentation stimulation protein A